MQIADAHNDVLMNLVSKKQINNYLQKNVVNIFTAFYVCPKLQKLGYNNLLDLILKKYDLISCFPQCTLTLENIGYIVNKTSLYRLIKLKPFCATLTWNFNNCLAGGAYDNGSLTNWGKLVINELENNQILIDVAHLNEISFYEFIKITSKPIFCSHTCSKSIYSINRNLSNIQLKIIKDTGGFVGLCLYNSLLYNQVADFELIRKHLDVFLQYAGENNVGFGTDFNGTGEQNPIGIKFDYIGLDKLYDYLLNFYDKSLLQKVFYQNLINFKNKFK